VSNLFCVIAKNSVLKDLKKLQPKIKRRIRDLMLVLKADPIPYKKYDVKKLIGYENVFRIRMGKLRILYQIDWESRTIIVREIKPRGRVFYD